MRLRREYRNLNFKVITRDHLHVITIRCSEHLPISFWCASSVCGCPEEECKLLSPGADAHPGAPHIEEYPEEFIAMVSNYPGGKTPIFGKINGGGLRCYPPQWLTPESAPRYSNIIPLLFIFQTKKGLFFPAGGRKLGSIGLTESNLAKGTEGNWIK